MSAEGADSTVADMTLAELTAWIQTALREAGVETVLSGGSCVTVWSNNAYQSDDIDLIADALPRRSRIIKVMLALGFTEKNRYFTHPDTRWWIEFPPGPLGVGEERPRFIDDVETAHGVLRLLSPTDCIKDRLTWFIHDQDRQCLAQAAAVARNNNVDNDEIKRWAKREGARQDMLDEIMSNLKSK